MDQKTLEALQALAAKMGTTAEYLWIVMVRQARVLFVVDLIMYALGATAIYALYKGIRKCLEEEEKLNAREPGNDKAAFMVMTGLFIICGFCIVLAMCLHLPDTITKAINPEYWALQQILETVKGTK